MKFSVGLPHETKGDFSLIIDYAQRAEEHGFDSVAMADHVFFENEVLTTFAAVAMKTRKLKMATFVLDGNRRNPAMLAHVTATLDRLSGGRLILGIGKGVWNEAYYGLKVSEPVSRMEKTIELLKLFWSGEEVTDLSQFFKFEGASNLKAKPLQTPRPPIWVAAFGGRMLRIALRLGDGFINQNMPPKLFRTTLEHIKATAERVGADFTRFEAVYGCMPVAVSKDKEEARRLIEPSARSFLVRHANRLCRSLGFEKVWSSVDEVPDEVVDECFTFGTPRDIESKVEEYRHAGATYMTFQQVLPLGIRSLDLIAKVIERFR